MTVAGSQSWMRSSLLAPSRHADVSILSSNQRRCLMCMSSDSGGAGQRKKVVFLGTPDIAALSLKLLLEASRQGRGEGFDVVRVVSNPPAKVGRKKVLQACPVQALAESEGVPVMVPERARDEDFLAEMEDLSPDLCITAAYGQFLPRRFLDIPKYGTLNVHPSLLPLYRGASPVQRCLQAGDSKTGVSVAFTVLKMDSGPIVKQIVSGRWGNMPTPCVVPRVSRPVPPLSLHRLVLGYVPQLLAKHHGRSNATDLSPPSVLKSRPPSPRRRRSPTAFVRTVYRGVTARSLGHPGNLVHVLLMFPATIMLTRVPEPKKGILTSPSSLLPA